MKCLLCQTENTKSYLMVGDSVLVKCQCGLVYANPQPTQEELAKLYPKDYVPYQQKIGINNPEKNWLATHSKWYHKLLRKIKRTLISKKEVQETIDKETKKTFLDFGYGNGRHLLKMQQLHPLWTFYGYDIDDRPLPGISTTSDMSTFKPGMFDIITASHVIEHVPNPKETLFQLKSLLKPQGQIIIELPNIDTWKFRVFGKHYGNLCMPYHLHHFSPKTLTELVHQCGFNVQSFEFVGTAKCTVRSFLNLVHSDVAINPYVTLVAEKITNIMGKKRLDTDIMRMVVVEQ